MLALNTTSHRKLKAAHLVCVLGALCLTLAHENPLVPPAEIGPNSGEAAQDEGDHFEFPFEK